MLGKFFSYLEKGEHLLDVLQDFPETEFFRRRRLDADGDEGNVAVWRFSSALISEKMFLQALSEMG